jgi:PadR family transcriptional regulator PadR
MMAGQGPGPGFRGRGRGRAGGWAPGRGGGGRGWGGGMGRGSLLEPALLASLASQATHGYDLRKTIETLTEGFLAVDPGGLYRILRRLEEEGFVESKWAAGEFGPQKREYELTDDGRELLEQWARHLRQRRSVIDALVRAIDSAGAGKSEQDEANESNANNEEGRRDNA